VKWLQLETLLLLPAESLNPAQIDDLTTGMQAGLRSGRREGLLLAAQASLRLGLEAQRQATQRLQAWTSLNPRDALAWQTLAGLYLAQQQTVRSARAEAEARLAHFDTQGALDRLRAAQQLARNTPQTDHVELSILDARVRQTEALLREQLRDAR
jgi:predicted Zn-dependent protease